MANLGRRTSHHFLFAFQFFMLMQLKAFCYQYKVGDLDAWGIPTAANPNVYTKWAKYHTFKIGDSLLFLYPPSQDSVIQVTEESYNTCNLKNPILYMNNGNSLFNITSTGEFYFTSGEPGHCQKGQRLQISLPGSGSSSVVAYSPSYGPASALPESSPSYPTVFGSIPMGPSGSDSSTLQRFSCSLASFIGLAIWAVIYGCA